MTSEHNEKTSTRHRLDVDDDREGVCVILAACDFSKNLSKIAAVRYIFVIFFSRR